MQEDEQRQLQQRNAELERLVQTLKAQLQAALPHGFEESAAALRFVPSAATTEPVLPNSHLLQADDPVCGQGSPVETLVGLNAQHPGHGTPNAPSFNLDSARYQALVEDHRDLICCFQADGTLTYANEACCRYFGQRSTDLLGQNFFDVLAAATGTAFSASSLRFEHQSISSEGRIGWHDWTQKPICDATGAIVEIQAVGRDISDRKGLEEFLDRTILTLNPPLNPLLSPPAASAPVVPSELRQALIAQLQTEILCREWTQASLQASEERYRSVVAAMHEGVLMLSAEGVIQTCNASAEAILGCTSEDLAFRTILELNWQGICEDHSPFEMSNFPGLVTAKTGIACSDIVIGLHKAHQPLTWISVNSQPLFRPGDLLPYAVVVSFSDITARKWIEADRTQFLQREQGARADAELAREQISQVLQSITDGFIAFDQHSRFTYVNHEAARALGRSARDLLGKVLWTEFPGFAETSVGRLYRRAMSAKHNFDGTAEGTPLELEGYYAPWDGWYSFRAYPSKSGVSLFFRNLTDSVRTANERDQAQEALKGALQRLSFHVDNSPFAVIEWDRDLRVTRWSREAENLLGWSANEVLGRQFGSWNFVVREDLKIADHTIAELLNGQATHNVCYSRNYTKTGNIVHCEWYNSVLFDESGELVSIMSLVLNVGDRKQAEEELRESEERFRQLAENIQQIFWMYDLEEQKLIYISPVCQQVIGYENERCYDKPLDFWLGHVRQNDLPHVMKVSRQAVRGKPAEVIFRFVKPDGAERWLLARAFPVRNAQGRIYRIAGIAEDISDRKEQERRLRLLESVVVNANDAVVITAAEPVEPPGPKIIYVNDAFTRMMGYRSDEVIGRTPRILQGPKTDWGELKHIRTALKNWQPALAELVNYHKDGSEVWIELSIFPVTDQTGHYTYWVGLQRDVTQRKRTEEVLQRQTLRSQLFADITLKIRQSLQLEEILQTTVTEVRNLLKADRVLIYRLLPDETGIVCNEAVGSHWASMLGNTYPKAVFFPDSDAAYCNNVQAVEDTEQEVSIAHSVGLLREIGVKAELVVPIVQQQSLWGLLIAHQCDDSREWSDFEIELLQQLANQVDIALTQSQLLQAQRESEERFRTMANSAPVLLWVINTAGECIFCNQSLLDFTGSTFEQEQGSGWHNTVHPVDLPYCRATYEQALATRTSFEIEYRLRRADGEYRWVLDRGVPRFMPNGNFGGHIGSCIDITDRKQAEVEMQKALEKERELSELKSRFVSTASHEFRTPLSTILSSADLLEFYLGNCTVEKQLEHIERIQGAALNMNNLLSDVLVIERAEAKFEPTELDLQAFCQKLVAEMQLNDQDQHHVELQMQASADDTQACMDTKLLRQILTNLLSNALKYSPVGSTVTLRLGCDRTSARFEVADEGIGIPPEDQGRLFEPFHRGTNVGAVSGNGLGLAIVKQSVDAHGGQVAIASHEKGGTTVCVTLPLQPVQNYDHFE
ncbi:PAS domain S-box protein [Myxacorys almedinensis]|uniref:histidine kinase n=1 Tax=Myxacorys almedinensis A TaxID=2690445 RepID=A0A8J7Z095_9CYAN|nr:PAS domain S-box protein [Myxacorys almedinensis]NDJ15796.1 PAS domain S-box protein [Myxacorys almedinensis A]